MQENENKVENGQKILDQIKKIKGSYEAEQVDVVEEEMSFLDRLNRLVQLILNDTSFSVYNALDKESLERWHKKRFSRWLKRMVFNNTTNFLYFIFLATITGFLVSEALTFYAIDGIITTKTFVKAILTEVSFIFLSGYVTKNKWELAWVSFLRAGVFCLMLFVITSQTIDTGTKTISENAVIAEQVAFIEKQIADKEKEIVYYRDVKNWPRNTRERILEKEELVAKLIKLKEEQASGKNEDVSQVEKYKMYGRAAFRVLLLFITVLITRRIFKF